MIKKAKVLFFAADPDSVMGRRARLQLDEEVREIQEQVDRRSQGDDLVFETRLAARPQDLIRFLRKANPQVVHFSGHGGGAGLVLVGADPTRGHRVRAEALAQLFEHYRGDIRVVVLNACESLPEAEAIAAVVGCAIGARTEISDAAAITFGSEFYGAIASGASVQAAFKEARVALSIHHFEERDCPQLVVRDGVDPDKLFVVKPKRSPKTWVASVVGIGAMAVAGVVAICTPPPCAWAGEAKPVAMVSATSLMQPTGVEENLERAKMDYAVGRYGAALPRFRQLAARGNLEAIGFVGTMLLRGEGTPVRPDSAVFLLRQAAYRRGRDPNAMTALGYAYEAGIGVERSVPRAREWYNKAVGEKEWPEAMRRLGLTYRGERKDTVALSHFRDAVKAGSLEARVDIGEMYEQGEGTERDMDMAVCLYRSAAEAGSARAMLVMGQIYRKGIGLSQDLAEAAGWFQKAAERGSPEAMQALGELYRDGEGVPRDPAQARVWFGRAQDTRRRQLTGR